MNLMIKHKVPLGKLCMNNNGNKWDYLLRIKKNKYKHLKKHGMQKDRLLKDNRLILPKLTCLEVASTLHQLHFNDIIQLTFSIFKYIITHSITPMKTIVINSLLP
jgi:hypothetical protein